MDGKISAPDDETSELTSPQRMEAALLVLVDLCQRDNIGKLDMTFGPVTIDGKDHGEWEMKLVRLTKEGCLKD